MFQVRSGSTLQIAEGAQIWVVLLIAQYRETVWEYREMIGLSVVEEP